jgi:MFS family permease
MGSHLGGKDLQMSSQKIFTRDFVFCFFAQFTFTAVFHTLIPTLPIYLSRLGSTEVEIGVLIGSLSVSSLVLRPFVGRALIKIPERNFMIVGALIFALTSVAYLFASSFWPFLMVRVFQGIGMAFFYTASVTLIANISPEAHRGQSLSYFYLAFNISFALAPSFGMFLINLFSFAPLFLSCLGLSLCSLFLTTRLGKRQAEPLKDLPIQDDSLLNREALPSAIIAFFAHTIWGALTAFFPLYALDQGVANPGFFFAAYAIVLIFGRTLGGKILDLYSREKIILPCLTTYIISMTLLAFSKTLPMFILVAVIWGIGNAFLMPSLVVYALDRAGPYRGTAMGTFTAIGDLGVGLGPVIMGIVLRLTSYPIMFLCLALIGVIDLNYFFFFVRKRETHHQK